MGGRGPYWSVGTYVRDPLNVEGPGWHFAGTGEDSLLEGLRGLVTAAAGGRVVVVPGRVGPEVPLSRSHLVKAARSEGVKAQ